MSGEALLLGRYDAGALRARLEAAGVLEALAAKGFEDVEVAVDTETHALPCATLSACRAGRRHVLLEAAVGEVDVGEFRFVLVYWAREQDPTRPCSPDRPLLPLQQFPGLGVLRRTFRVVVGMAQELGRDGVASVPKFFHDAVLFHRSRLFLFLDGVEEGRFEALARDLAALPLGSASIALVAGCARDAAGAVVSWAPGYQVFPLSSRAVEYFHSPAYAADVARGLVGASFTCDAALLASACESLGIGGVRADPAVVDGDVPGGGAPRSGGTVSVQVRGRGR